MNDRRSLEIAIKIVRAAVKEHPCFKINLDEELPNMAKKLKIPVEELAEFLTPIIEDVAEEMMGTLERIRDSGNFPHP